MLSPFNPEIALLWAFIQEKQKQVHIKICIGMFTAILYSQQNLVEITENSHVTPAPTSAQPLPLSKSPTRGVYLL